MELKPARDYVSFNWPINAIIFNLQNEFQRWYRWALSHCETCCPTSERNSRSKYENNNTCKCRPADPYRPTEKWGLQKALAYGLELYIDKSSTRSNWSRMLDPKYTEFSRNKCNMLTMYAINDCLSVSCLRRPVLQNWTFNQVNDIRIIEFFFCIFRK